MDVLFAFGLTLLAGVSTGIGSLFAFFTKRNNQKFLAVTLGFSAGVMIYVSMIEIFQKAQTSISGEVGSYAGSWITVGAFFLGIVFIAMLDKFLPKEKDVYQLSGNRQKKQYLKKLQHSNIINKNSKYKNNNILLKQKKNHKLYKLYNINKVKIINEKILNIKLSRKILNKKISNITIADKIITDKTITDRTITDKIKNKIKKNKTKIKKKYNKKILKSKYNLKTNHLLIKKNNINFDNQYNTLTFTQSKKQQKLLRMGIFTALAISIHNFPEGLATFMSALQDPQIAVAVAIAIAIHNIPEGIAVAMPIYYATGNRKKAFLFSFLSGLTEPIGALIGYLIFLPIMSDLVFGIVFASVAGIMVFISLDELLPASREYGKPYLSMYGLIGGMLIMALSLLLFM